MSVPTAPRGLGAAGRRLWRELLSVYVLDPHERAMLTEACHTADTCAVLQAQVAAMGPALFVVGPQGVKAAPAVVELRQQRLVLARLLASLRIPAEAAAGQLGTGQRTARRAGARGVYAINGGRQ